MRYLLLTAALAMNMQAMLAQSSYQVKNSVTLRNKDCDLTKMSVILPVPVSNIYQDVVGLKGSSGTVLDLDASNRYLRDIKTDGQPSSGESYTLSEEFSVTLYPMYIDMAQFTTLYPYDTESAIYKRYTADKGGYIDTSNPTIRSVSDRLWGESGGEILDYARLCYEYVAANFKYLYTDTGINPIATILSDGGGDCGNLASIFVNLMRAKKIPAKHIVTVRPDGSHHVWADFYLERYGWIPVDVNARLVDPRGNYFGYCRGDGIIMSEDICHEAEFLPGEKFEGVILQTFWYWYWYRNASGTVEAEHALRGRQTGRVSIPVIEETRYDGATLSWNLFPGATGYRSKVYEKATGRLTDVVDVPADASSMPLDGLDPETEYGIVFTPLRMVGNIETSMGTYDLALKTAAVPTANGEIPMAKAATVWGKDGRLSVHLASPSKVYISAFDGRLLQAVALPAGDTSLALSAGRYIIRVGNEVFKVAL